jgi:hypothetical protein
MPLSSAMTVAAAIRAVKQAGLTVSEVKITPEGEIVLSTNEGDKVVSGRKRNRLDDLYENPINVR